MNVIAQLEFELANYFVTIQHFSHYTMRTPQSLHEYYSREITAHK